jgi:hypothetical protein
VSLKRHLCTKQARHVQRNIEAPMYNHCCIGKTISITCSECVLVALVIQHAMRMRRVALSYVACMAQPYFSKLYHKGTIFGKKMLLFTKRVF